METKVYTLTILKYVYIVKELIHVYEFEFFPLSNIRYNKYYQTQNVNINEKLFSLEKVSIRSFGSNLNLKLGFFIFYFLKYNFKLIFKNKIVWFKQ